MNELEKYLRWLGKSISEIPHALKNFAVKVSMSPYMEILVGMYTMVGGVIAIVVNIWWNRSIDYVELIGKSYILGLRNPQWSLITLVGFFLFTHGIYRGENK